MSSSVSVPVGNQAWMQVLEAIYKKELIVEAHGPNISIHSDAAIFETTDLTEDQVAKEVKYLLNAELITWVNADEDATEFKQYRLTKEGFQVIHEHKQVERQLEWEEEQQKWRREQRRWENESTNTNKILTAATIVLAGTALIQAATVVFDLWNPEQWIQVGFYIVVIWISLISAFIVYPHDQFWNS